MHAPLRALVLALAPQVPTLAPQAPALAPQVPARTLQAPAVAPQASAPERNVLLVVADDLGVDEVGAYGVGSDPAPTPTIDRLAAEGVLFRNCWANPVCSPTRATLQTGRYSFRTGVGTAIPAGPPLPLAEVTLPEALALGGAEIESAAIGKWHLGGGTAHPLLALHPNLQGWDHFSGVLAGAFVGPFSYTLWPKTVDGVTSLETSYATTDNVDDALAWIEDRDGPWLLWLAFNAPHTPFHAPPAELHDQALPPVPPCLAPRPFHHAMVEAMDRELGRLLASLAPEVRARTTVIVVGDNGTTGAVVDPPHEPDHAKGSLYQGGVRVPLVVSGPDVVLPGRQAPALVNTVDLFPTVLELLGVDAAAALPGVALDGVSLVPYLEHPLQPSLRSWAFAEVFHGYDAAPTAGVGGTPDAPLALTGCVGGGAVLASGKAIRNATHKLIRFDDGREELYHLLADPLERLDLLALPALPPPAAASYAELAATLDALLAGG